MHIVLLSTYNKVNEPTSKNCFVIPRKAKVHVNMYGIHFNRLGTYVDDY